MLKLKLAKPMLVALAACAASVAFNGVVFADDAQTQALKDQMRIMQQQMQELQKQFDALSKKQAAPPAAAAPAEGPSVAKERSAGGAAVREVRQGLLRHPGRLDRRFDQGHGRVRGLSLFVRRPGQSQFGLREGPARAAAPVRWEASAGSGPVDQQVGDRLARRARNQQSGVDFIYQIEVQPAITPHPALTLRTRRSRMSPRPVSATATVSSGSRAIAGASSRPAPRTRRTRNPPTA